MSMKHTPGPWEYCGSGIYSAEKGAIHNGSTCEECGHAPTECGPPVIVGITSGLVADIKAGFWDGTTEDEAPSEADLRLIAAAPELLESCQTFAEWLRREDEGFVKAGRARDTPEGEAAWREWFYENMRICDLAQKQARSAIAKATGAQP